MATVNEKMTAIADAIRSKTGGEETLTLDDMASGVDEVYDAGKRQEWSDFWDAFQNGGKRNGYSYAFYGQSWNDKNFKPKYNIKLYTNSYMFGYCEISDLEKIMKDCGVIFEKSNLAGVSSYMFDSSKITRIPELDLSGSSSFQKMFQYCQNLVSIRKLIFPSKVGYSFSDAFKYCSKLTDIVVEGVIGRDISFSYSPLTVESLKSIISCLTDYSGTTSEYTYTVTFKATAFEALEAEGTTSPNGNTWTEYIDDLKWNLTLA